MKNSVAYNVKPIAPRGDLGTLRAYSSRVEALDAARWLREDCDGVEVVEVRRLDSGKIRELVLDRI